MADPVHPLDDDTGDDPNDVEQAWADELERRRREIREGNVALVDGEDVMRRLRRWSPNQPR